MSAGNSSHDDASDAIDQLMNGIDAAICDLRTTPSEAFKHAGFQTELPADAAQIGQSSAATQLRAATPTPPPRRPKGRLLIGFILMALFAGAAFIVWDGLFRYRAYGIVEARSIEVRALSGGIVQRVLVAVGDRVRCGELLAVIADVEVEDQLQRSSDAVRLAEAQLEAQLAKLRRIARQREWDTLDNAAEFFELASRLRQHRSEADRLERQLERALRAREFNGISEDALDQIQFALEGEQGLLEMLAQAIEVLKQRRESIESDISLDLDEIGPTLVQIENLQNESLRLYERLAATRIVSPITGVVTHRKCVPGHRVEASESLLEVVEDGTVQPVLYLSQRTSEDLTAGSEITIHVEPLDRPVVCRVLRPGESFQAVPVPIVRFYDKDEPVLPVYLEPAPGYSLRPGAIVKLPHEISISGVKW